MICKSQGVYFLGAGLSTRAPFEGWEWGRWSTERAARAYLTVIARHPDAVVEALAG
jgi:DNA-binding transcriptional regulator YiaG